MCEKTEVSDEDEEEFDLEILNHIENLYSDIEMADFLDTLRKGICFDLLDIIISIVNGAT